MPAYLFVQEGPSAGAVHVLDADVAVVGRGDDCTVRLADEFVSRRHFQIERAGDAWVLVDLGSRNATVLNGATERGRKALRHGDVLVVGGSKLRFSSGAPQADKANGAFETAGAVRGEAVTTDHEILGTSAESKRVAAFVERVAGYDATVLVTGESGTGKEVVARAIHRASPRSSGRFVAVNCAAIPRELVESELFGHEKGAFTGALARHAGRFEQAHGGTIFLDEIGELPLEGQAKLLRVLEERTVTRVGGAHPVAVDVRIVAATNRDLHALAKEGRFRVDLIYRLEVARVDLAPLRRRREDVEPLARHFLARCETDTKRGPLALSSEALERLRAHDWPGNVRELKNVVERASIFGAGPVLGAEAIELGAARDASPPPSSSEGAAPMEEVIQAQVERALAQTGGNKKKAAELLKISRSSLYNYLDRFKLR